MNERERREINEIKRLIPDRLSDPLLDVGMPSGLTLHALGSSLLKVDGGSHGFHPACIAATFDKAPFFPLMRTPNYSVTEASRLSCRALREQDRHNRQLGFFPW